MKLLSFKGLLIMGTALTVCLIVKNIIPDTWLSGWLSGLAYLMVYLIVSGLEGDKE
jgi:hypothetical protein